MTNGSGGGPIRVETDGVSVEKSFAPDEFPVPAVKFVLSSDREEPIEVSLVDDIPPSFPMERVGFHPQYDADGWTAYEDQRVEYRRELAPDETTTTVYGIRTDDAEDGERFLDEPRLKTLGTGIPSEVEGVDEVLGDDSTDGVREVIAGDRDDLPGLDEAERDRRAGEAEHDPEAEAADAETEAGNEEPAAGGVDPGDDPLAVGTSDDDPLAADDSPTEAVSDDSAADDLDVPSPEEIAASASEEGVTASGDGSDDGAATVDDDGAATVDDDDGLGTPGEAADPDDDGVGDEPVPVDAAGDEDPGGEPVDDRGGSTGVGSDSDAVAGEPDAPGPGAVAGGVGDEGGVAAALAREIREGRVDEDDLDTLRSEIDLDDTPASVDVRISQLQSQVGDLVAYTDALAEFLDENGRGRDLLDQVQTELDAVTGELEDVGAELATAERERESIADDVADVEATVDEQADAVDAVTGRVDDQSETLGTVEAAVDDLAGAVSAVVDDVESIDSELGELRATLDDHDDELDDAFDDVTALEDDLAALGERVDAVDERVSEVGAAAADAGRVADLEARIDDLAEVVADDDLEASVAAVSEEVDQMREELNELAEFRRRINAAFGGGPGVGGDGGE